MMSKLSHRGSDESRNSIRGDVLRRCVRASLLALGLLSISQAAAASDPIISAKAGWINQATIRVTSNHEAYLAVSDDSSNIVGAVEVYLNMLYLENLVRHFEAWPLLGIKAQDLDAPYVHPDATTDGSAIVWQSFKQHGFSESYHYPGKETVVRSQNFTLTREDYSGFAVFACNRYADELRAKGMTSVEIFSKDRPLKLAVYAGLDVELRAKSEVDPEAGRTGRKYLFVDLICLGDQEQLDPVAQPISDAVLTASAGDKVLAAGNCALNLTGSITSRDPKAKVTFRYVDDQGRQSDLKTVVTGDDRKVALKHEYPLPAGFKGKGAVQMVGMDPAFQSNWAPFEVECADGPQGFVAEVAPKVILLQAKEVGEVEHGGYVCPAKATIIGRLKGRGDMSGAVGLFAAGELKKLQQYSITNGENIDFTAEQALKWNGVWSLNGPPQQNLDLVMNVTNKAGELVEHVEKRHVVVCRKPENPLGPPQAVSLEIVPTGEEVPHKGKVCPANVKVYGVLKAMGETQVGMALLAGNKAIKWQVKNLAAGKTAVIEAEYPLDWSDVEEHQQKVDFTFNMSNEDQVVFDKIEKSETFACRSKGVGGVAATPKGKAKIDFSLISTQVKTLNQTLVCPSKISVKSIVESDEAGEWRTETYVELLGPGYKKQMVEEGDHSVSEAGKSSFIAEFDVYWNEVPVPGAGLPELTVNAVSNLVVDYQIVATRKVSTDLACKRNEILVIEPRGLTSENVISFFPKKDSYSYTLEFRRKQTGGGYVPYDHPSLPTTTTLETLLFPLEALQGGQFWQLEVCNEYGTCGTSEFELAGAAGAAAPGGAAQPGGKAVQQQGKTFGILAPKGTVQQGVIKLSGGKVAAKFTLKFFRKMGGKVTLVTSAQLPKTMQGIFGKFPLEALTGGRNWRLEICPQGQGAAACKTTDFRLPAFGGGKGKPTQPKPTAPVIIIPGAVK